MIFICLSALFIGIFLFIYKKSVSKKSGEAETIEKTAAETSNNENYASIEGKDDTQNGDGASNNSNEQMLNDGFIHNRKTVVKEGEFICEYTEIRLSDILKEGDYADIRLSLADGRDFTVLSGKQIMDYKKEKDEQVVWLPLCEEEIIILDSAIADTKLFDGAKLYLALGSKKVKNKVNYPVNHNSERLLRPMEDDVHNLSGYSYEVIFNKKLEKERKMLKAQKGIEGQEWKEAASYWNKKK